MNTLPSRPALDARRAPDMVPELAPLARRSRQMQGARLLSAVVAVLMGITAAAGVWIDGVYKEPGELEAIFRGYDLVALIAGGSLLALALLPTRAQTTRVQLMRASILAFCIYNYAFYLFGAGFNDLFLPHVSLFAMSIGALALTLSRLDVQAITGLDRRPATRVVGVFFLLLAAGLAGMWSYYSLRYAVDGTPPDGGLLVMPAATVHLTYALDLGLLVPAYGVAGVLLWRQPQWGYVLAAVMATSGVVHQFSYMAALMFQGLSDVPGSTAFDPAEPFLLAAFLAASATLLRGVRRDSPRTAARIEQIRRQL